MVRAIVGGRPFDFTKEEIERRMRGVHPEPIREHLVEMLGTVYPPKQVLGTVSGWDRTSFTTMEAQRVLTRAGFVSGGRAVTMRVNAVGSWISRPTMRNPRLAPRHRMPGWLGWRWRSPSPRRRSLPWPAASRGWNCRLALAVMLQPLQTAKHPRAGEAACQSMIRCGIFLPHGPGTR